MIRLFALLPLVLAAACGRGASDDELRARARRLANAADPAITAALIDPIMTDRDLTVADNSRRVRIVAGPAQAYYPLRDGHSAAAFAPLRALGGPRMCETGFRPGAALAGELPPAFRPPVGATLIEAAGNDRPGCRARFALFRTPASAEAVAAQVRARALAAGYGAEGGTRGPDHFVAGRGPGEGPSFYLIASSRRESGSEVAVIAALP